MCNQALCPDCVGIRVVHPAELLVCTLCGELAQPLLVTHRDSVDFFTLAGRAATFPFTGPGVVTWAGIAFVWSCGLWFAQLAQILATGLIIGLLFGLARAAGRGVEGASVEFESVLNDIVWPLVRFAAVTAPAWVTLLFALGQHSTALGVVGVLLAFLWCPTAFLGAAAGAPISTLLNPLAMLATIRNIGADVSRLGATLVGLVFLGALLGVLGALVHLLPVPLLSTLLASMVWWYAPIVGARVCGAVLWLHPEPFGWHEGQLEALPGVMPRGVVPERGVSAPVAPIEVHEPMKALPTAEAALHARFADPGQPAPEESLAPLPARAQAFAQLEMASMATHLKGVVADGMTSGDHTHALEAFKVSHDVGELDAEQLVWLGRSAVSSGDVETGERALRLATNRAQGEALARTLVLLARLLGERLGRPQEAQALMGRVVSEFAGTKPAEFASRWLAGPP